MYPPGGRTGLAVANAAGPPPEPTAAAPGTPEKVAVLEARAAKGQRLWNPADARLADDDAAGRFLDLIGGE